MRERRGKGTGERASSQLRAGGGLAAWDRGTSIYLCALRSLCDLRYSSNEGAPAVSMRLPP